MVGEVSVHPAALDRCETVVLQDGEGSLPAGTKIYEIVGVSEELAREAFRLAAAKLPLRTTFVARMIGQ